MGQGNLGELERIKPISDGPVLGVGVKRRPIFQTGHSLCHPIKAANFTLCMSVSEKLSA